MYQSVTDDDMDDCRSECSYYSLLELDETDPVRRIPGSVVKQQAEAVPAIPQLESSYPHIYYNSEQLPLRVAGPLLEHPLMRDGPYSSGPPGPARVVVSAVGGKGYDVIYHPKLPSHYWGHKKNTFAQARYHPKESRRSNTPAQNQYSSQSPLGLVSLSTIQLLSNHHYLPSPIQTPNGAHTLQELALSAQSLAMQQHALQQQLANIQQYVDAQQKYLDMQNWLLTQPLPDTQQHFASKQPIITQQNLGTQQCVSQPSPFWNNYSSQMMATAPLIPVGGPMNYA